MPIASTFMFLMGCCGELIFASEDQSRHGRGRSAGRAVAAADPVRSRTACARLFAQAEGGVSAGHPRDGLGSADDFFLSGRQRSPIAGPCVRRASKTTSAPLSSASHLSASASRAWGRFEQPIGGFLLCIPSNLPENRIERAFEAIAWMTSPEAMKANVQNGFPVAPRFSVSADPEAAATSPISAWSTGSQSATCLRPGLGRRCPKSVARGDAWRRDPPGFARRGVGPGRAEQCAGRSRQVMREAGYY